MQDNPCHYTVEDFNLNMSPNAQNGKVPLHVQTPERHQGMFFAEVRLPIGLEAWEDLGVDIKNCCKLMPE